MSHPVVHELIPLLEQKDGHFELTLSGQKRLSAVLDRYKGRPDLKEAARSILMFGFFLQRQKGSPQPAIAIVEVLQQFKTAVLASSSVLDDVLASVGDIDRIKRVVGDTGPRNKAAPSGPSMSLWQAMASS